MTATVMEFRTKEINIINTINKKKVNRGEIWEIDLGIPVGSEQGGIRPCVIIQNEVGNKHSSTFTICPLTSQSKPNLPTHVDVDSDFLKRSSTITVEQMRTVDKKRFKKYIGRLDEDIMQKIDIAIKVQTATLEKSSYQKVCDLARHRQNIKLELMELGKRPRLIQLYYEIDRELKEYCITQNIKLNDVIEKHNSELKLKIM